VPMASGQMVNFAASDDKKMTVKTLDGKPAILGPKPNQSSQDKLFETRAKERLTPEKSEQGRVQNFRQVYIQLGAFAQKSNAENMINKLSKLGRTFSTKVQFGTQPLHRVRMGPFINAKEADIMFQKLLKMGYQGVQIVVE
jgi:cell division protein FtsN